MGSQNSDSQWITSSSIFQFLNGESMTLGLYLWEFVESLTAFPQQVFIVVSHRSFMAYKSKTVIIFTFASVFLGEHNVVNVSSNTVWYLVCD